MREEFKEITLSDRKWRIEKFDAFTGSYIAFQILEKVLPSGLDSQLQKASKNGMNLSSSRGDMMSKKEFTELQKECLKVCYEVLPAGLTPVIREQGGFGVIGIEKDTILVLGLTINAILFNVMGFFQGDALKELTKSLSGINPFNAST